MRALLRLILTCLLLAGGLPPAAAEDLPPLTLPECYRLALKRSEEIAIRGEVIKETEGRFLQALSTALPNASFVLSEKRQDGSGGSIFTLESIPERRFAFSQPLFSGFKEFAAIAGSRSERRQREHERTRAEQLLFVDVAEAFHLLLQQREDLRALETIRSALVERAEELRERERLGRSRTSEVVSAESQLHRVVAEQAFVSGQEQTARQLLAFLIGRDPGEGLSDAGLGLPVLADRAVYLSAAATRPDVLASEEAWKFAKKEVAVERAGFWPGVDLESNYYTKRVGVAADVDWDVLVTVDVPIFQGGEVVGAVREAASKARQAKLAHDLAGREAVLDVENTYNELAAALQRSTALAGALAAAEEDYRLQLEDYRRSLINNLDVLQVLQTLQDTRRDEIRARHEAHRLYWRLLAETGEALSP
ncbi:MAG: hypothetical protein A3C53_08015 [Omnitrophica WOR_2 bacterium RIFCSPHIGHO2_02_FULL_68_15]|nr:MAG: hypothetical protein A3C53_08015 [Omnitrophica WOR_2 bacterium RIFCSPHIGHO2_02_FULL_68_15]